jgi:hypothetical protein
MAETWFDTRTGDLLVGEAAIEERQLEAGPAIKPLNEIINAQTFEFSIKDFEKADINDWTREDYVSFGKWALRIINEADTEQPLTERKLQRFYKLGLGPEKSRLRRPERFGTYARFQLGDMIIGPCGILSHTQQRSWRNLAGNPRYKILIEKLQEEKDRATKS